MKTISEMILNLSLNNRNKKWGQITIRRKQKEREKKTLPRLNVWATLIPTYPLQASLTSIHRRETMVVSSFQESCQDQNQTCSHSSYCWLILWIECKRFTVYELLHLLLWECVLLKVEVERYRALCLIANVV